MSIKVGQTERRLTRHTCPKSMTHTDIYHTLIRNGFREKLDKKGVPTGALVFPHRPIGIKLWGMVDCLKRKHNIKQVEGKQ